MTFLLQAAAVFFVLSGIIISIMVAIDLKKRPQSMKIMNAVWILTSLWGSYLALWAYYKFGRSQSISSISDMQNMNMNGMDMKDMNMKDMDMKDMDMKDMDMKDMDMKDMDMKDMDMEGMDMGPKLPHWQGVALSALHCGAGCTLADIIGEWFTFFRPVSIASSTLIGSWTLDFVLALIIGVIFQFFAIREMEKISVAKGFVRAFKADFFSLLSWQVGMYLFMALCFFVFFKDQPLHKDTFTFWFMMQIAMLFGFFTSYPTNILLIKLGIKKSM